MYVWDAEGDRTERVGSLLLGNRVLPPGAKMDAEQLRYKAQWKISIDKMTRYRQEMAAAQEMLEVVKEIDYNQLRACGAKKKGSALDIEAKRPIANQLKTDIIKNRKEGGEEENLNDVFEGKT